MPNLTKSPRSVSRSSFVIPLSFRGTCRCLGVRPTRFVLFVNVREQKMRLVGRKPKVQSPKSTNSHDGLGLLRTFRISTSRFGIGQEMNSNRTPLGLHRIARKVGGGWPLGAVFKSREMMGYTWRGNTDAAIAHRILWLEGLEPNFNRGGRVDTFARYIYIHGTGDEPSLGRPASCGCIHVSGAELLPLYDLLPQGTLVWIE